MLDRIAEALEIETYQLFDASTTPEGALLQLEKSIVSNIKQAVKEAVKETLNDELKDKK